MNNRIMEQDNGTSMEQQRFRENAEAVKEDLDALKDDTINTLRSGADATITAARSVADQVSTSHEKLCKTVASRPTTSLLVALGVGALAGRLIARR